MFWRRIHGAAVPHESSRSGLAVLRPKCGTFPAGIAASAFDALAKAQGPSHLSVTGAAGLKGPSRLGFSKSAAAVSFFVGFVIFGC
jgi:hypothetical protein